MRVKQLPFSVEWGDEMRKVLLQCGEWCQWHVHMCSVVCSGWNCGWLAPTPLNYANFRKRKHTE